MGGMLATGVLSLQGVVSRHVRSVTMLGSGCFGAGSWHSVLKPLVLVLCYFGFPGHVAGSAIGRLVGTWAQMSLVETAFYWRSNIEVGRWDQACALSITGVAAARQMAAAYARARPTIAIGWSLFHPISPSRCRAPCCAPRMPRTARDCAQADEHVLPLHTTRPRLPVHAQHELAPGGLLAQDA